MNLLLILVGKFILFFSKTFNLGSGSTWPGHIALEINPNFIRQVLKKNPDLKIVLVAGTNGKTTTATLLRHILEKSKINVFQNEEGANLLNGIGSSIIKNSNVFGKLNFDTALFEVDENSLPLILDEFEPNILVLLNLFRDQLDRYGEVNTVAGKWSKSLQKLKKTKLIVNGDHPELAWMAKESNLKSYYFSIPQNLMKSKFPEDDADFLYCPNCKTKLNFNKISFSSLGLFECPKCEFSNPESKVLNLSNPLTGDYNYYNVEAASVVASEIFGTPLVNIENAFKTFKPAFGRQEVFEKVGKKIMVILSKNPASLNRSFEAVLSVKKDNDSLLMVLNDRIPDGRDISWIWDTDFENFIPNFKNITVSGDRCYDLGLRIKYGMENQSAGRRTKIKIFENLKEAIGKAANETSTNETLFILPTYSAMLEVRKILSGRKIL